NPAPGVGDLFGLSLAVLGSDRVVVGASFDTIVGVATGSAYLFNTNGTLLTTFTNPAPSVADFFGNTVSAVGNDRVLITANSEDIGDVNAGVAYLFSTNGTLLVTITNPAPAIGDSFGFSATAVGNDRLVICAINHDTGASNAGIAYLIGTNGTLLATFNNPSPALSDIFGASVAVLGGNRLIIGAYQD